MADMIFLLPVGVTALSGATGNVDNVLFEAPGVKTLFGVLLVVGEDVDVLLLEIKAFSAAGALALVFAVPALVGALTPEDL